MEVRTKTRRGNFTLYGSNDHLCENHTAKPNFVEIHIKHSYENYKTILTISTPQHYRCYKIMAIDTEIGNFGVKLWEYFPEFETNIITTDVTQSQPSTADLAKELNLSKPILIAKFDTPVYATNYSLRISKNIAYKLEGIKYMKNL